MKSRVFMIQYYFFLYDKLSKRTNNECIHYDFLGQKLFVMLH